MDKIYYIQENGQTSQAYSLEDLETKNLQIESLVCKKYGTWKKTSEYPEIVELINWKPQMPKEILWKPSSPSIDHQKSNYIEAKKEIEQDSLNKSNSISNNKKLKNKLVLGSIIVLTAICLLSLAFWKREYLLEYVGTSKSKVEVLEDTRPVSKTYVKVNTNDGDNLRLRSQPSDEAPVVSLIPNKTILELIKYDDKFDFINGEKGKWCNVDYEGRNGWAWGGFLKVSIESNNLLGNNDIIGEYSGKIGEKEFKLMIERIDDRLNILGYNITDNLKRPIQGMVWKNSRKIDNTYSCEIRFNEPGDHEWDGEFIIYLFFSKNRLFDNGNGSWKANNGRLKRSINLKVKSNESKDDPILNSNKTPNEEASTVEYNFENHHDINVFIEDLAKAINISDKETITKMINIPLIDEWGGNPYNKSESLECKNSNQFKKKYDKIFTKEIIMDIRCKKYRSYSDDTLNGDVINKGEFLIEGNNSTGMFAIKKVKGKYKIYALKFYS